LTWTEILTAEVKSGKYSGYTGYHEFTVDIKEVCRSLDGTAEDELDETISAKVKAARDQLEALRYQLSTAITPDALKTFEEFKKGYEALMKEAEDPEIRGGWKWSVPEDTKDKSGTLERIKELQRMAETLPTELYVQTKDQRTKLVELLSEEAIKEFDRIIGVLEEWCRDHPGQAPKEAEDNDLEKEIENARGLFEYMSLTYAEEIRKREKLELLANGNKSVDADVFVEAVEKFVGELGCFAENFATENGEELTYKLLAGYSKVMEAYERLDSAEKDLERVKEAKGKLENAWEDHAKKRIDPELKAFLESVYALKSDYEGLDEDKAKETFPWKLQLAYESCMAKKSEDLVKKFGDTADFKQAVGILEEIGEWLEDLADELRIEETSIDPAGTYNAGDPVWAQDASISQVILENAEMFLELVETMEGGLSKIHGMCQRMQELVTKLSHVDPGADTDPDLATDSNASPDLASGSNASVDRGSILTEIGQIIKEIDRVVRSTEYNDWHGLAGGDAYAVIAPLKKNGEDGSEIHNPMQIKIPSMTVSALKLDAVGQLKPESDRDAIEAAGKALSEAIEEISAARAELGARQNLSEHVITAMHSWIKKVDNGADTMTTVHAFTGIKRYPSIEPEKNGNDAIPPSLKQTEDLITNIQLFEGILTEEHDMLQRMNELMVQWINGADGDGATLKSQDIQAIQEELWALSEGLTFLGEYVSYDGWHGLCNEEVL